ncbi:MAG: dipeptidase PepE [Bacteroidales bacterium]|nr:dipeptidase PepE [Bacteroidales bacterium]HPD96233.1 dipeptidase PepE [Tenuifilaceae bacterium]HRX32264.1 dipeptidase PepE [Tenuifilaceae bacterium]
MKLLLISNSTNAGEAYLEHPKSEIKRFLGDIKKVLFFPWAAVTFSYDEYEKKVQERFSEFGVEVDSIHHYRNTKVAVQEAEAIVVGGGNTFKLIKTIQQHDLIEVVRNKVLGGTPYIGWSAGSNVACPTISTTNDMPITEPDNFGAFSLVRFQINPHFLDSHPEGHAGETREDRIMEFIEMDPYVYVVGLREGSSILLENTAFSLLGSKPARIFKKGMAPKEVYPGDDLDFLFE